MQHLSWLLLTVTTRVVFLYRVLIGIASYIEQNLAIRSRLYGVEYFCYSEQVKWSRIFSRFRVGYIRSRTFQRFRVGYAEQNVLAVPSTLCGIEYFSGSEQVIRNRLFLLLRSSRQDVFKRPKGLRRNAPIPSSTGNRNSTRVGA